MGATWLVESAHARNLLVLTYGLDNDDPACVTKQHALGVHAAIIDDVAGVMPAICTPEEAVVAVPAGSPQPALVPV